MSWWNKIYYKLLNLPLKMLVKSEPIPSDPITELQLDPDKPILYVLPYYSKSDLLVIRSWCLQFNLNDPLIDLEVNGLTLPSFVFIDQTNQLITQGSLNQNSQSVFHQYLDLHRQNPDLDIQMVPVSVLYGRKPDKEGKKKLTLRPLNGFQKLIRILRSGRNCFVRYSRAVSLRYITDELGYDEVIAQKLSRLARIHFSRQRLAAVGPQLPNRQLLFKRLLESPAIKSAIEEEAKNKKISQEKAQKLAHDMLDEIAADFNYRSLRMADRVLTWAWNKLYQGLKIHHAETIRTYAQEGYEIVYAPCHRSHMDYLLLSYVLYRQGLVPPHIAAGINLNFWPAGPIFRRLGAFFIRRSFKGNKLYTVVFREYLSELFTRGYSVEYFVEGGRSRTGRLLDPKTGTLSITLQAMLRGDTQPIIVVPVYIGYENVIEVGTYTKELKGAKKEKENMWLALRAFTKLKNLGLGFVSFGQPIPLTNFLNQRVPEWRESISSVDVQRPAWLNGTVNQLAHELMQNINGAASVNAMNLCSSILLSSHQHAVTKELFLEQMTFYLMLLNHVPYSDKVVIPSETPEALFEHIVPMKNFQVDVDKAGEIISITRQQAVLMTYYRNNIQHLLIIPALMMRMILNSQHISRDVIMDKIRLIYPLIKAELFIYFDDAQLTEYMNTMFDTLIEREVLIENNHQVSIAPSHCIMLQLFAANADETLQRYLISLSLLRQDPSLERSTLEKQSQMIAERLSLLHGINSPESFDKNIFSTLFSTLKAEGYLDAESQASADKIQTLYKTIKPLVPADIKQSITSINIQNIKA